MNEWTAPHSNFVMQSTITLLAPARRALTIIPAARLAALHTRKPIMKKLLQIAGVLSFLFPFVGGVVLLIGALSSPSGSGEAPMLTVIGFFLIGNAFFAGAILLFAAEKLSPNDASK